MEHQQNWAVVIHAKVLMAKDINPNQKILLGLISNLTNIDNECYATNDYFSSLLDMNKSSGWVSKLIADLEKKGYLKTELFYKENSKEIEKRIIRITYPFNLQNGKIGMVESNKGGVVEKYNRGIVEKYKGGMVGNYKENNTLLIHNTLCSSNTLNSKNPKKNNTPLIPHFDFDELLAFGKAEIQKINLDFSKYEYSLRAKLETWQQNGWKDGHNQPIKNAKMKIKNIIPYLKEFSVPQNSAKYENDLKMARMKFKATADD